MSDPAIEAAERQYRAQFGKDWTVGDYSMQVRTEAAREALAPLRELEVPQNIRVVAEMLSKLKMDTPADQKVTDDFVIMLRNMADNIEPLIYPSEEL